MNDADVAVVGVGAIGSMALWQLSRAGASTIGFERFWEGHDRSAAGGESRLFRMAYHEGAEYVPLLAAARDLWLELERASGAELFTPTGCLSIGDPDSAPMRNVRASIEANDLPHTTLDTGELAARYPQHRLHPGEVGIMDLQGGVLRPELAVIAATGQAREHGARLVTDTVVERVEPDADGVEILAGGRTYRVGQAVITTGPWAGRWLPAGAPPVTARRIVLSWFAPRARAGFSTSSFPPFIRDTDGVHRFGVPVMDGVSVKVGVEARYGSVEDPDTFVRDIDPADLDHVRAAVGRFLPGLHPDPIRTSVHMDGYSPDRHALVGRAPGLERSWLLGGFSGHGFKLAPVFGRIAADLVTEGASPYSLTQFDPARAL